jgi:L-asparaginase/Glu-tRNA(Gln) amidotransferase subunit D
MQLLSVISLLSSDTPNTDSPANLDAAVSVIAVSGIIFVLTVDNLAPSTQ